MAGQARPWHVEEIVRFALSLHEDDRVLIHCRTGISRSPAAATVVFAAYSASPEKVVAAIAAVRPEIHLDALIVRLGDERLGLGGALSAAFARWRATAMD